MKGGEGWHMQRCAGGDQDKSVIMNRTMLRFRPIAPKPVVAGADVSGDGSKNSVLTAARKKRKYVRVSKTKGYTRKKEPIINDGQDPTRVVTTLQLLPEKNDINSSSDGGSLCDFDHTVSKNKNNVPVEQDQGQGLPLWLSNYISGSSSDPTVGMQQMRGARAESWVTVQCLAGTCMNVHGMFGRSMDAERMRIDLENDTCPGFISDGLSRVRWLNGAFKRMVSLQTYATDIAVWLAMKEKLPHTYTAFTCQVKLQYMVVGKEKYSGMVPCDLWRMDDGGFAWRLDVKAALTLGR